MHADFYVRFRYRSRNYSAHVVGDVVTIVKAATRRFNESEPLPLSYFTPQVQDAARAAIASHIARCEPAGTPRPAFTVRGAVAGKGGAS